ncbi:MAG TPA: hypothetical protein VEG67_04885, partial [Myxococcota bacterium]|nr:hypothetical protein [Myxococcota bacterium]
IGRVSRFARRWKALFALGSGLELRASRAACAGFLLFTCACAHSILLLPQEPSATSQLLLVRALDRALAQLDLGRLGDQPVDVEVVAQGGNLAFAKEVVKERLREHGVHLSSEAPALKLVVLATVLGTDRGETLVGSPAMTVPVVSLPAPEIALFKWVRYRGLAELEVEALDPKSGDLIAKLGPESGHAKHDDFTVMIAFSFTVSDIDGPSDAAHPGSGKTPEDATPKDLGESVPVARP